MTDELKTNQTWAEISALSTEANIKSDIARSAWLRSTVDLSTLGQNEQVANGTALTGRAAAYAEYKRCHDEAFRISQIAHSVYRDMAGTDDHLFNK